MSDCQRALADRVLGPLLDPGGSVRAGRPCRPRSRDGPASDDHPSAAARAWRKTLRRPARHGRRRSLDVRAGELHAVIGPNGAGKTTLVHQVSGLASGRTAGRDPVRRTGNRAHGSAWPERVRLGLARSFQIIVRSCPDSRRWRMSRSRSRRGPGRRFRFLARRPRREAGLNRARARRSSSGSAWASARRTCRPALLSYGEKRQLELADRAGDGRRSLLHPRRAAGRDEPRRDRGRSSRSCASLKGRARDRPRSSTTWRPCSHSPTACPCWSMAGSLRPATPADDTRRPGWSGPPISARRRPEMLERRGPARPAMVRRLVLFGVSDWRSAEGEVARSPRPQRHGQDHDREGGRSGLLPPSTGSHPRSQGRETSGRAGLSDRPGRDLGLVPEGRQVFPTLSSAARTWSRPRPRRLRTGALDAARRSMACFPRLAERQRASSARSSRAASSRCWQSGVH